MSNTSNKQILLSKMDCRRSLSILLCIAIFTGWLVSIFSLIEEMCLSSACRDSASFTIFGFGIGWFGIIYFSFILLLLWKRLRYDLINKVVTAVVFAGIGAEFRLLWIQKYIIGSWCPLCVTIGASLFIASLLLLIEKIIEVRTVQGRGKIILVWMSYVVSMIGTGLALTIFGVKALT